MVVVGCIAYTHNAEELVETAYLQCHNKWKDIEEQRKKKPLRERIRSIMESGHFSVLEHPSITFSIRDISRSCSHQIVRHRIGIAISQMSMRCVEVGGIDEVVVPDSIKGAGVDDVFMKMVGLSHGTYLAMVDEGKVPMEDARMVLPIGTKTEIVMTFNARALIHFLRLRMSRHAQWEIRDVADKMFVYAKGWMPNVFADCYKEFWE